jgi:hypothetical protein
LAQPWILTSLRFIPEEYSSLLFQFFVPSKNDQEALTEELMGAVVSSQSFAPQLGSNILFQT